MPNQSAPTSSSAPGLPAFGFGATQAAASQSSVAPAGFGAFGVPPAASSSSSGDHESTNVW